MKLTSGSIFILILILTSPFAGTYAEESQSSDADAIAEIERLSARLEALRAELESQDDQSTQDVVDLSGDEVSRLENGDVPASVLAKPWYENVDVSGLGAVWLVDSGSDGTRPDVGFVMKESTLFIEAQAWEDVSIFFEVQTTLLQRDHSGDVRTAELYAHFRNILRTWGDDLLSVKIGRVDIPFGEEYLWQDAPDNPLISNSAAYPWLWDEGAVFYGNIKKVGWVAAVMDGSIRRSVEENADKSVTLKLYGRPWKPLFLSGSWMRNGDTSAGPFLLGGSLFQPVGVNGESTAGASPSATVSATLYELYAKTNHGRFETDLSFGRGSIDDAVNAFDRDLTWFMLQPLYKITRDVHAVARYSEIGTYDDEEGYHFDGEFLAGGNAAYGYDAKRLTRLSLGINWKINPRTHIKLEVGRDRYYVVDASPFDPTDDNRSHSALEVAVSF